MLNGSTTSVSIVLAPTTDRIRWSAKYECADPTERYLPISWLSDVLQFGVPEGPVLERRAVGPGTALGLIAAGRCVTTSTFPMPRWLARARSDPTVAIASRWCA